MATLSESPTPVAAAPESPRPEPRPQPSVPRWLTAAVAVVAVLALVATAVAWRAEQRVQSLQQELVRRQQDSAAEAVEARVLAKQAQDLSREAAARVEVLAARVSEAALQRSQLDELIQSLSRSRDENLLADIDAGLRAALQQTAITGSAAPLVAALQTADERLARANQPRLEAVRRAIARDLDKVKAVGIADVPTLASKLDDAIRLADDAPLLVIEPGRPEPRAASRAVARAQTTSASASGADTAALPAWLPAGTAEAWRSVWREASGLLRVTRIDQPQAMLLAPEQSYFLRENLKLKLLNARLALLSRQFDIAQSDVNATLVAIDAHFDRNARKTQQLSELLRGVATQSRQVVVPRLDDTLATVATAAAGR